MTTFVGYVLMCDHVCGSCDHIVCGSCDHTVDHVTMCVDHVTMLGDHVCVNHVTMLGDHVYESQDMVNA